MNTRTFTAFFPFCGIGGGARGFAAAEARLFQTTARFRVLGGFDFDKGACTDFEKLVGAPALCKDVLHITPEELRNLAGQRAPDVVFLSPPCKGASALLSKAKANTEKYRKMNRLTLDWFQLMLRTWDEPPALVLLENVPRLKTRAAGMLRKARALLRAAGYVFHEDFHECGEIGGLAQIRRRYLLVARHPKLCPPLLYQPPKKRVRGCGEVIGPMPLPEDPRGGPMHKLPRLSWLNWVRLALIPAGGDWRDLDGVLREGQARREVFRRHKVGKWDVPCDTITGDGSNAAKNVADPRISLGQHHNKMRVEDWAKAAHTVTGSDRVGSGAPSVADPRVLEWFGHVMNVGRWNDPANTVTHSPSPSSGAGAVADPRVKGAYDHGYGVLKFSEPSPTVAGGSAVGQGAYSVADERYKGSLGVLDWFDPAGTVTGESLPSNGRHSVADVRVRKAYAGTYGVLRWEDAAATIIGNARVDAGRFAVADPRKPPPFLPVIIAADGTWHRPLTTLELAALQGLPTEIDGEPLVLSGKSNSAWRERIGNCVPEQTAQAIAERMLVALLQGALQSFELGTTPVWVQPEAH